MLEDLRGLIRATLQLAKFLRRWAAAGLAAVIDVAVIDVGAGMRNRRNRGQSALFLTNGWQALTAAGRWPLHAIDPEELDLIRLRLQRHHAFGTDTPLAPSNSAP
jgi:hypothetical protein